MEVNFVFWIFKNIVYFLRSNEDGFSRQALMNTPSPDIDIEAALLRAESKQSVTADCGLL